MIRIAISQTAFDAIVRRQATLLPDSLEDYVTEDNLVRVVDVFIDELDLEALGFSAVRRSAPHEDATRYHQS